MATKTVSFEIEITDEKTKKTAMVEKTLADLFSGEALETAAETLGNLFSNATSKTEPKQDGYQAGRMIKHVLTTIQETFTVSRIFLYHGDDVRIPLTVALAENLATIQDLPREKVTEPVTKDLPVLKLKTDEKPS